MTHNLHEFVNNKKLTTTWSRIIYFILTLILIFSLTRYVPYLLSDQTSNFYARQYIFIIFLVIITFFYLNYSKRILKFQLLRVRMIIKNEADEDTTPEMINALINRSSTRVRFNLLKKNLGTIIIFYIMTSIIFYTDGLAEIITFGALVVFLFYYYNSRKIDPLEIKDSMKYDRQIVDLDGGIAAYTSDSGGYY